MCDAPGDGVKLVDSFIGKEREEEAVDSFIGWLLSHLPYSPGDAVEFSAALRARM